MKRIIRSCLVSASVCFAFCACARAAPPPAIFNEARDASRVPTLAGNVAAYVSVYCLWRYPMDEETTWDIMPGIVLDSIHVLTTRCDENEGAYMDSISVGPLDADNVSGHGPWKARQVTKDSEFSDLIIVATDTPMPLPSVVPSAEDPELGDNLYTVTSYSVDPGVSVIDLYVVSALDTEDRSWSSEVDFSALIPEEIWFGQSPSPTGVFNNRHEFVGFVVGGQTSLIVPKMTPAKFNNGKTYGVGYDMAATSNMLQPLMREIGIAWPQPTTARRFQ